MSTAPQPQQGQSKAREVTAQQSRRRHPADPPLLADSDDTGLAVVAKALLVASAPGLSGGNFYADSDRAGTDTPLDGELGLGADDTVISRFWRFSATELNLNDNNNPAVFDIGPYFDTGGDGNDLTLYLQTRTDGEVSFSVAAQFSVGGGNYARFNLPADAQTLLDNLATGDRWIFKAARPAAAITGEAEHASVVVAGIEGTGRAIAAGTVTGTGEPGTVLAAGIEGAGSSIAVVVRTGTGEHASVTAAGVEGTGSNIVPLMLADSDDAGLDVELKALLVASAPGTVGNDPYADANRGGTDTPLDGEIGIGPGNTLISRFRRLTAGQLTFNDNDDPAALDIGVYFDAGGDGNDLTVYLQTLDAGEVSFTVAAQYAEGGGNYARVDLPADAQALLDNLATGDRWIFKLARPSAAEVRTGDGEHASVTAAGIEGTGRKLDAATRTGTGEAGTAAAAGIEGTGHAIAVVTQTGSGELGAVVAEGIEGTGVTLNDIRQEFDLGEIDAFADWFGSILINPLLVVGGAAAYLRSVERIGTSLRFTISDTATGDASQAGPELIPEWEVYEQAIT